MTKKTWFTPESANRTLPLVRTVVADILEKGRELQSLVDEATEEGAQRIRGTKSEMLALLAELERIGCSYRDWNFSVGLVDFPAILDGEEVLLCWRSDEDAVRWFHAPESGYAGRKPIPDRFLGDSEERSLES